jgi:hypothetical protein
MIIDNALKRLSKREYELWHPLYQIPEGTGGCCDADWICDVDEIYATSEHVFSLRGGTVS